MNIKVYSFKAVAKDFLHTFHCRYSKAWCGFLCWHMLGYCTQKLNFNSCYFTLQPCLLDNIQGKYDLTSLATAWRHFVWRFSCQVFQCVLHLILSAQRCSLAISSCGFTHANSLQLFGIGASLLGRNSKRVSFTHASVFVFLFHVFPFHRFLSFFPTIFPAVSFYFSFLLSPAPIILISSLLNFFASFHSHLLAFCLILFHLILSFRGAHSFSDFQIKLIGL